MAPEFSIERLEALRSEIDLIDRNSARFTERTNAKYPFSHPIIFGSFLVLSLQLPGCEGP